IISNHNNHPGAVWFDDITIEHVHARKSDTPLGDDCFRYWEGNAERCAIIEFGKGAVCGNVVLRDIIRHETQSTPAAAIALAPSAVIDRLLIDNLHQTTADGAAAPVWDNKGTIRQLIERDPIH
ncbi:MAG: hypothetical protein IJ334_18745, partial [Clostridia bacterium]|nr:hypothetical protein [Clostridia bacterium]